MENSLGQYYTVCVCVYNGKIAGTAASFAVAVNATVNEVGRWCRNGGVQDSGVLNSNPTVGIILIYNTESTIVTTAVATAVNFGCGRCYISCSFVWRALARP